MQREQPSGAHMKRARPLCSGHGAQERAGTAAPPNPSPVQQHSVQYPTLQCPGCSSQLFPFKQEAIKAKVLDCSGWTWQTHVPLRCRNLEGCAWQGKRVWHNYVAVSRAQHTWVWPADQEMKVFYLWNDWGVTTAWLRQMSRRLVHHFASFHGEAAVHAAEAKFSGELAAVPPKAPLKLMRAWIVWRAVLRAEEHALSKQDPSAPGAPLSFNLIQNTESMLDGMWAWYPDLMLSKRVELCRQLGEDLSKLVMDGNMKLSRRVCGRPVAELNESKEFGLFTATPCSCTPGFKQRRCQKHNVSRPLEDRGPEQMEVIVKHRRKRVLRGNSHGEPYQVQLKVKDQVDDRDAPTRWVSAGDVTPGQLYDYWKQQEAVGYLAMKSPPHDLASTSCTTHKEGTRGYKRLVKQGRLCGWLVATTSNGVIVHAKEFVGAESVPQRYFFLGELAAQAHELEVLVHDDACHLRRFADKRREQSDMAARLSYPRVQYIIDKMHAKGHVDKWCLENCHPDVPKNAEAICGVRTPACETVNSVLGRHKFALRHMRERTASFFMHEVIQVRNAGARK